MIEKGGWIVYCLFITLSQIRLLYCQAGPSHHGVLTIQQELFTAKKFFLRSCTADNIHLMFAYGSRSSSIFQHGAQETAHSQQNHKTGLPTTSKINIDQG